MQYILVSTFSRTILCLLSYTLNKMQIFNQVYNFLSAFQKKKGGDISTGNTELSLSLDSQS